MATLTIGDKTVTVDDAFLRLSPEEQNATVEEIAGSLGIKGSAPAEPAPEQDKSYSGSILPFSVDAKGEAHFDTDAGVVGALKRAFMTPGEVYKGNIDLNTPEGQDRAIETALTVMPTTAGRFGGVAGPKPAPAAPQASPAPALNSVVKSATELSAKGSDLSVPLGLATDNGVVQGLYQRSRNVPGAANVIDKSMDTFYKGVEQKVGEVAAEAAGGAIKDKATLGASVRTSVEKAVEKSDDASEQAFKIMRRAIDPEKRVDALTDDVAGTLNRVMTDRAAAGEGAIASRLEPAFSILTDPKGVSFDGLQRARSQVGKAIKWDEAQGGFNAADLKQVYGSLTSAMESAVKQSAKISPEGAVKLWKAADARFSKMVDDNKVLSSVLRKEADEGLVSSLVSMASAKSGNARKLAQVLREIGPESRSELSGFVIQGLGAGRDGNFSALAFTNNWKQLSSTGKAQLFQQHEIRQALDNLATVTERMAEAQKKYSNPSGTGATVGVGAALAGMMADPVTTLSTLVGANVMARALSRPVTAKAVADYAKAMEMYVKRPSAGTARLARGAAEKLSNRLAAEVGAKVEVLDLLQDQQPSAKAAVSGRR